METTFSTGTGISCEMDCDLDPGLELTTSEIFLRVSVFENQWSSSLLRFEEDSSEELRFESFSCF